MNKEQLGEFLKKQAEQLYGRILDEVRVTELSERAFKQISIDIKKAVRETMEGVGAVVGEFVEK